MVLYTPYAEEGMTGVMGSERWHHHHPTNLISMHGALKHALGICCPHGFQATFRGGRSMGRAQMLESTDGAAYSQGLLRAVTCQRGKDNFKGNPITNLSQ